MKYNELKNKSKGELLAQANELRRELFQLRLKLRTAQLANKAVVRQTRRDVARLETCLTAVSSVSIISSPK
ncbi:MAG: 50S ribosomal protein L29 [Chitinophagia bacterium]|nr:50S ribosomal protein L29 [Chitinophagia bacterium]